MKVLATKAKRSNAQQNKSKQSKTMKGKPRQCEAKQSNEMKSKALQNKTNQSKDCKPMQQVPQPLGGGTPKNSDDSLVALHPHSNGSGKILAANGHGLQPWHKAMDKGRGARP